MSSEDAVDWSKLPLDQKLVHKSWKARSEGYEELNKKLVLLDDENEMNEYVSLIKKFPLESNPAALDKAMECLVNLTKSCPGLCQSICSEVMSGMVAKTIHGKAKVKQASLDVCMTFIEEEKHQIVLEKLLEGCRMKLPKAVAASAEFIQIAIRDFGGKVIDIKAVGKELPNIVSHNDKNVRDFAKLIACEMYLWMRDGVKSFVQNVNATSLSVLEKEFEALGKKAPPKPTRYLKSQRPADLISDRIKRDGGTDDAEEGVESDQPLGDEEPEAIDPYEFMDPVDIIPKLSSDFHTNLAETKWSMRKEAYDGLLKLCKTPKIIHTSELSDLIVTIRKTISNDSNVVVTTIALECVDNLAKGLRSDFSQYVNSFLPVILEKLKDKKTSVLNTVHSALDSIYNNSVADAAGIIDLSINQLENKNPAVRAETCNFISRIIFSKKFYSSSGSGATPAMKANLKKWTAEIFKKMNDANAAVRDSAALALAAVLRILNDKIFFTLLDGIDEAKRKRITDSLADWKEKNLGTGAPSDSVSGSAKPVSSAQQQKKVATSESTDSAKKSVDGGNKDSDKSKTPSAKGGKPQQATNPFIEDLKEISEPEADSGQVDSRSSEWFGEQILENLATNGWKDRLAAVEKIGSSFDKITDTTLLNSQIVTKLMLRPPGMKDANISVLKAKMNVIMKSTTFFTPFSRRAIKDVIHSGFLDKCFDSKLKDTVTDTLMNFAEASSLNFVAIQMMECTKNMRNAKIQAEILNIFKQMILAFGLKIDIKHHVASLIGFFDVASPEVKKSATSLYGTLVLYMGPKVRVMFDSLKPAMLTAIDAEAESVKGQKPPPPTRFAVSDVVADSEDGDDASNTPSGALDESVIVDPMEGLVERVMLADKLSPQIFTELEDSSWKIRLEGVDKIKKGIASAKYITPNISCILSPFGLRISDSNKTVVGAVIEAIELLAECLGPIGVRDNSNEVILMLMKPLSDSAQKVRTASIQSLNKWCEQLGKNFLTFLFQLSSSPLEIPLTSTSVNSRSEMLSWIKAKFEEHRENSEKTIPTQYLSKIFGHFLVCCTDRNQQVRKSSQEAIVAVIPLFEKNVTQVAKLIAGVNDATLKTLLTNLTEKLIAETKTKFTPARKIVQEDSYDFANLSHTDPSSKANTVDDSSSATGMIKDANLDADLPLPPQNQPPPLPLKVKENGRDHRALAYSSGKSPKWLPTTVTRSDCIEPLKQELSSLASPELYADMFHSDFKKNMKAFDVLLSLIKPDSSESPENQQRYIDCVLENADLLLRWISLKLLDNNSFILTKSFEFLNNYLDYYLKTYSSEISSNAHVGKTDSSVPVSEYEMQIILPFLILKIGDQKETTKKCSKALIDSIESLFGISSVVFHLLITYGLENCKSSRTKLEVFDMMCLMINRYCINVLHNGILPADSLDILWNYTGVTKPKFFRELAACISDRAVRNSALNLCLLLHALLGGEKEAFLNYLPKLDKATVDTLFEKIKRNKSMITEKRAEIDSILASFKEQEMLAAAQMAASELAAKEQDESLGERTFVAENHDEGADSSQINADQLGTPDKSGNNTTIIAADGSFSRSPATPRVPQRYQLDYHQNADPISFAPSEYKPYSQSNISLIKDPPAAVTFPENFKKVTKNKKNHFSEVLEETIDCIDMLEELVGGEIVISSLNELFRASQVDKVVLSCLHDLCQMLDDVAIDDDDNDEKSQLDSIDFASLFHTFGKFLSKLPFLRLTTESSSEELFSFFQFFVRATVNVLMFIHISLWKIHIVSRISEETWKIILSSLFKGCLICRMSADSISILSDSPETSIDRQRGLSLLAKFSLLIISHICSTCPFIPLLFSVLLDEIKNFICDIPHASSFTGLNSSQQNIETDDDHKELRDRSVNYRPFNVGTCLTFLYQVSRRVLPPYPLPILTSANSDIELWTQLLKPFDTFFKHFPRLPSVGSFKLSPNPSSSKTVTSTLTERSNISSELGSETLETKAVSDVAQVLAYLVSESHSEVNQVVTQNQQSFSKWTRDLILDAILKDKSINTRFSCSYNTFVKTLKVYSEDHKNQRLTPQMMLMKLCDKIHAVLQDAHQPTGTSDDLHCLVIPYLTSVMILLLIFPALSPDHLYSVKLVDCDPEKFRKRTNFRIIEWICRANLEQQLVGDLLKILTDDQHDLIFKISNMRNLPLSEISQLVESTRIDAREKYPAV